MKSESVSKINVNGWIWPEFYKFSKECLLVLNLIHCSPCVDICRLANCLPAVYLFFSSWHLVLYMLKSSFIISCYQYLPLCHKKCQVGFPYFFHDPNEATRKGLSGDIPVYLKTTKLFPTPIVITEMLSNRTMISQSKCIVWLFNN